MMACRWSVIGVHPGAAHDGINVRIGVCIANTWTLPHSLAGCAAVLRPLHFQRRQWRWYLFHIDLCLPLCRSLVVALQCCRVGSGHHRWTYRSCSIMAAGSPTSPLTGLVHLQPERAPPGPQLRREFREPRRLAMVFIRGLLLM